MPPHVSVGGGGRRTSPLGEEELIQQEERVDRGGMRASVLTKNLILDAVAVQRMPWVRVLDAYEISRARADAHPGRFAFALVPLLLPPYLFHPMVADPFPRRPLEQWYRLAHARVFSAPPSSTWNVTSRNPFPSPKAALAPGVRTACTTAFRASQTSTTGAS